MSNLLHKSLKGYCCMDTWLSSCWRFHCNAWEHCKSIVINTYVCRKKASWQPPPSHCYNIHLLTATVKAICTTKILWTCSQLHNLLWLCDVVRFRSYAPCTFQGYLRVRLYALFTFQGLFRFNMYELSMFQVFLTIFCSQQRQNPWKTLSSINLTYHLVFRITPKVTICMGRSSQIFIHSVHWIDIRVFSLLCKVWSGVEFTARLTFQGYCNHIITREWNPTWHPRPS